MSIQTQIKLARSRWGRIELHLLALLKDRKTQWHFAGIVRELRLTF